MTDTDLPELSKLLPRELAAELIALARAGGADFADLYAEHAIVTGFALDERRGKNAPSTVLPGGGGGAVPGGQTGAPSPRRVAPRAPPRAPPGRAGRAPPAPPPAPGR